MIKKKVLIITPNALHNGPRLIREIDALKSDFEIVAVGATPPHDALVSYIPFTSIKYSVIDRVIRKVFRTAFKYPFLQNLPFKEKRIHRLIKKVAPDFIIAHSPIELPYLFSYPNRKFKVVYNAHEYHPLEFDTDVSWMNNWGRLYADIYRKYLNKVDLLINVCDSIAEKCSQEFGKTSLVIPNAASYYKDIKPFENAAQGPIRIIHHGGAVSYRKIELMIEAVSELGDQYSLDLMLIPSNKNYYESLAERVNKTNNVKLIDTVAFDEIVPFINQYDIGLYNLPANNYNERIALPNKFFEFIQARLCIVVSPSVEMKRLVEKYTLGGVSKDFTPQSIAEAIRGISREQIYEFKQHSDKAAKVLSAEFYQEQFRQAILTLN